MSSKGFVRLWHLQQGWGVLDSLETPGGVQVPLQCRGVAQGGGRADRGGACPSTSRAWNRMDTASAHCESRRPPAEHRQSDQDPPQQATPLAASVRRDCKDAPVTRLPDDLADSIVFICASEEDAHDASKPGGTGFIVQYPLGVYDAVVRYLVTAAHVFAQGGRVLRVNRADETVGVHRD